MEVILAAISPDYAESPLLTPQQKALIAWTAAITRNTAAGDDPALAALKQHYSDAEIAELTLMSCLFNGWNRFTHAFHIQLEAGPDRDGIVACLARTTPVEVPVRE
jgi:alkylhydroperoxidase family enzyme